MRPRRFPNREARLPATLNVRILGIDANGKAFHQAATTLDISLSGARINGVTVNLRQGDILGLQSGGAKSRFKVAWVIGNGDGTFEIGLECTEKGGSPWHNGIQRLKEGDRRNDQRFPCKGSVSLHSALLATPIFGVLCDVSERGCYVQCATVAAVSDILSGEFIINDMQFSGVVEVCHSLPTVGMGLRWCDLGCDGQETLKTILHMLLLHSIDANSGKTKVLAQVNTLRELVTTLQERPSDNGSLAYAETIVQLSDALEETRHALKSVQS